MSISKKKKLLNKIKKDPRLKDVQTTAEAKSILNALYKEYDKARTKQ